MRTSSILTILLSGFFLWGQAFNVDLPLRAGGTWLDRICDKVTVEFTSASETIDKGHVKPRPAGTENAPVRSESRHEPVDVAKLFAGALMSVSFEGDLDAVINGRSVEPSNASLLEITRWGDFTWGVVDKGFRLNPYHAISYVTPSGVPSADGGTISVWVRPGDWFTPQAILAMKRLNWPRQKVIWHADDVKQYRNLWRIGLKVVGKPEGKTVRWRASLGGRDLTHQQRIDPEKWYLMTITWEPNEKHPKRMHARLFLDGRQVGESDRQTMPLRPVGARVNLGCTNAGIAFSGTLDQFYLLGRPLSPTEIASYYRQRVPSGDPTGEPRR